MGISFGPYTRTLKDSICEHFDCNWSISLSVFAVTLVATMSYGLSPLLSSNSDMGFRKTRQEPHGGPPYFWYGCVCYNAKF